MRPIFALLVACLASLPCCTTQVEDPFAFLDVAGSPADPDDGGSPHDATSATDTAATDTSPDTTSADTTPFDAAPEIPPVDPDWIRVRIGTFNVLRLFDDVCDSGRCDDNDFEAVFSEAGFGYRVFQIAEGVRQMDVDVLLLQEIENQRALNRLLQELGDAWRGSFLGEIGGDATLDVAVVSRFPLVATEGYRDEIAVVRPDNSITTFAREFLQAELEVEGRRVIVFTSHFKSKNNDDAGRRLGEAQSAREIVVRVARENPGALVVFGGDINDTPGSAPLDALEAEGALVRVEPEGDPGTLRFGGQLYALDHLYLAADAAGVIVPGETRVVRDASGALGGSDHAAVRAEFAIP